jgi:hypothetical protein
MHLVALLFRHWRDLGAEEKEGGSEANTLTDFFKNKFFIYKFKLS